MPVLARWILICALVSMVIACATHPVPGGGTYGITVYSVTPLGGSWKTNVYDYAGRERAFGLGKSVMSGLTDFHVLKVRWITASGKGRSETIDIAPLIERMQAEKKIKRFEGLRTIVVEIDAERLAVSYEIVPRQGYVAKKGARRNYALYESTHN